MMSIEISQSRLFPLPRRCVVVPALIAVLLVGVAPANAQRPDDEGPGGTTVETVPVPEKRPGAATDAEPDVAASSPSGPAEEEGDDVSDGAALDEEGDPTQPAAPANPEPPVDMPDPSTAEAAEDPAKAPLSGEEAAERPITAIPLPERRPAGRNSAQSPKKAPADQGDRATPEELRDREPTITPEAAVEAAAAIADARICEDELTRRGVSFTVGDSISEGDCGVLRPVDIDRLSSGVTIAQPTQLLCRSALALDIWVASSVVPAAKAQFPGDAVTAFRHASTYVCRSRSSGSRISEHARGSGVDVADFGFASGRRLGVEKQAEGSPEQAFQREIREGACGPFKTVLGPGTDADHATHFHLDIAARRNGATYCK